MNTTEQEEIPPLVPPEPKEEWAPPADEPLMGVKKEPRQIYVSREDLLESENLQLRAMLLGQNIMIIQGQIEEKSREQQELHVKLLEKRDQLQQKYGINLATHSIRPTDGLVIANNTVVSRPQVK